MITLTAIPAIAFPAIDPVLVEFGPLAIRWYALAWIAGLLLGWRYIVHLVRRDPRGIDAVAIDDFLVWATIGAVLGGRLGYVLFYQPGHFLSHPIEIVKIWQGGMSFHGGLIGVIAAMVLFAGKRGLPAMTLTDLVACAAPIGLFFGRIANFINAELYGRPADVPWAVIFPNGGPVPRHPSQLYESLLEGALLFVVLWLLRRYGRALDRPGLLSGVMLLGYALARSVAELFREPDAHLGFLVGGTTMGQLLSAPMILLGVALVVVALRSGKAAK